MDYNLIRENIKNISPNEKDKYSQINHLLWMVDVVENKKMFIDKKYRWIGFIFSYTGDLFLEDYKNTVPLAFAQGYLEIINRYIDIIDDENIALKNELFSLVKCLKYEIVSLEELSFRVGRLQGKMIQKGIIDVETERNLTRPIFHKIYADLGWSEPDILGPESK